MGNVNGKVGAVFIVVGRTGMGKSPTIKALMQQSKMKNNIVYDRRREYDDSQWTRFLTLDKFKKAWVGFTDSFIVVEEATGFISGFKEMDLTDILIGIQHNRNVLVLVFHSLMDTPKYIQRLSDFMYLFPTNDNEKDIRTSRSEFLEHFIKCGEKNAKGWYMPEIIDMNEV